MRIPIILCLLFFVSCGTSMKLAIPTAFEEQATMLHVKGSRTKKMSFGNFTTSKIKRGMHVISSGPRRGFLLENILLNEVGIQKGEHVEKEKAKFRYSLSDGQRTMDVFGREIELTRNLEYKILPLQGIFSSYSRLQNYQYIFSAEITDAAPGGESWDLMMTNIYDRRKDTMKSLFTVVQFDDNGLATNGKDTIFIKGLTVKKTESPSGKPASFPIKLLSGYELSTADGVIAIIDIVDSNIWFYKELEAADRLIISAISTAIFARKVKDAQW